LVNLFGVEVPPPASKITGPDGPKVPKGAVKILATAAPRLKKGKSKWIDVCLADLAKLVVDQPPAIQARVVGPVISGCGACTTAKTDYMGCVALFCRMFRSPPPPRSGLWKWAASFTSILLPAWDDPPESMSDEDWIASMPANRRKALTEALELWKRTGWCSRYSKFRSFIKLELLPLFEKTKDGFAPLRETVARLINAPHDVTHAIAGPMLKPFAHWLKAQWSADSPLFYGSVSPEVLRSWLCRATAKGPRLVFWSDYSMFDSSHNADTWALIESLYTPLFSDPVRGADFRRVLEAWRCPSGYLGNLKYTGRVMNASGRDDTAFANALLNGLAMFISVTAAWWKIPLLEVQAHHVWRIMDELMLSVVGDDALGFLPPCSEADRRLFEAAAKSNLREFGLKAKFFTSYRFEDAVYLGHRPVTVDGEWYWSRTLGRCLYKLGYQVGVSNHPVAHFAGIANMHATCSQHTPVLADICRLWMKAHPGTKINRPEPDPNKPWETMGTFGPGHYSTDTLECLARAYTVAPEDGREDIEHLGGPCLVTAEHFRQLISWLETVDFTVPCVMDHWLLRRMVWVDEQ
jgi:hypothetical protein